jgi:hypothetical protein
MFRIFPNFPLITFKQFIKKMSFKSKRSNLPFNAKKKATIKSVETKVNNINEISSDSSANEDVNDYTLKKYYELLELKKKLLSEEMNKENDQQQQQQKPDDKLKILQDYLRVLTENDLPTKETTNHKKVISSNRSTNSSASSEALNSSSSGVTNQISNQTSNDEIERIAFDELRTKLSQFEMETNRNSTQINNKHSLSLVNLVNYTNKIVDHLKQTTNELNKEKLKNDELKKQVTIHRRLIDGLTTEILGMKEQNEKILFNFVNQQAKHEAEMEKIKFCLQQLSPPTNLVENQCFYQLQNNRPISASKLSSYNDIKRSSSETDPFSDRLNAMLSSDNLISMTSFVRPNEMTSSSSLYSHQPVKEMKSSYSSVSLNQLKQNSQDTQRDNLEKLKKEQMALKDQINKLNKERESAKFELEILANSMAPPSVVENPVKANRLLNSNGNNTPSVSPIPNDNQVNIS